VDFTAKAKGVVGGFHSKSKKMARQVNSTVRANGGAAGKKVGMAGGFHRKSKSGCGGWISPWRQN
jgi:hypothetical protein